MDHYSVDGYITTHSYFSSWKTIYYSESSILLWKKHVESGVHNLYLKYIIEGNCLLVSLLFIIYIGAGY